ncbi:MAG: zf-HC2 domain-containing protein [Proteobacteria bacterium]|nr:zf-HC2 domain-containing protein [Pseudomonadota bacterium]
MRCREFDVLWAARLEGRLLPAEAARVDAHVASCVECGRLAASLEELETRLEILGEEETVPPAHLATRIRAHLEEVRQGRRWPFLRLFSAKWLLVGTSASLAFFAGLLAREVYRLNEWFRAQGSVQQVVLEYPGAESEDVRLVGDFNGWGRTPGPVRMQRREGRWVFQVELSPGRYQYAFLVDGKRWLPDPGAPSMIPDGFGGANSVLYVERRGERRSL